MSRKLISLLSFCLAAVMLLTACASVPLSKAPAQTVPAPSETDPVPSAQADPVQFDTYTVSNEEAAAAADAVAATMGSAQLTNAQLWTYYWLEVAAFRQAGHADGPDFSLPLDTQPVLSRSSGPISWQQYFLDAALNTWASHQALVLMGQEEGVPTEEAYLPDLEKRIEYLTDKPANRYLYGWSSSYQPNRLHQDYLDSIPSMLIDLAYSGSFGTVNAMAEAMAGVSNKSLLHYTELANRAYMYFTEMGYHFEPTPEEIEAYYHDHQSELSSAHEKTVNIRHILLIPENAEIAADGTVTASEDSWNRCLTQVKNLVAQWEKEIRNTKYSQFAINDIAEARFSELAKDSSADEGSRAKGGLYQNLAQGQLIPELDAWSFDPVRQHGDYEIIRSACGYHLVYFSSAREGWYADAEAALRAQYDRELLDRALASHPVDLNRDAIRLNQVEFNGSFITPDDLLYPDVAHERFPDMPLYLQQDYPEAPYGAYLLRTHGCGITTLAMVASYLADDELTPVELAADYGYYCGPRGTEQVLLDDTPAEMGFHLKNRSGSWSEVAEAVRNGHVAISLQWAGYWTSGGHYLAIVDETEDERYVVRDSNLLNYKRITAHQEDSHTRGSITQACHGYWIYEKKVTRTSACVRCGEDGDAAVPQVLFQSDYHCEKCLNAMARRSAFLTLAK